MSLFRYGADNVSLVTVNPSDQGEHLKSVDGALKVHLSHEAQEIATRLMSGIVSDGHQLWVDLKDADHLYLLEAPIGSSSADLGFVGVRLPRSLVGTVGINNSGTLSFDTRTSDGGWV